MQGLRRKYYDENTDMYDKSGNIVCLIAANYVVKILDFISINKHCKSFLWKNITEFLGLCLVRWGGEDGW